VPVAGTFVIGAAVVHVLVDRAVFQPAADLLARDAPAAVRAAEQAAGGIGWGRRCGGCGPWGGLAPGLDPSLRGPLAYVLGLRYQRLGRVEAR
jgi:hypothetical protein